MPQYLVMFDEAFQRILEMSPNATRLSLRMGARDLLVSSMRQYDLSNVVHLDVQVGNERLSDVLLCLPQFKHLTILSLSFDTFVTLKGYDKRLTLEHLQEFQITVMWSPLDFLDAVARKWKLPCLCRFTIYEWRPKPSQVSKYLNFLDAHGKCLTTLSITAPLDRDQRAVEPLLHLQHVQAVLDRCPALEHLALFPPMTEVAGHEPLLGMQNIQMLLDHCSSHIHGRPLSHKTLRWIDIWATWHPSAPNPSSTQVSWKSQCFPQFHAIRLLDWALLITTGPRLHLAIPPGSMQHHETLQWRFPGVHVQHDAGHIYKRDMDYVSSYMAACDGHESPRSIPNAGVDSMSGDSDYDSDDETFESVSSVSYSAHDSEEGDLETIEYLFVCSDDLEKSLEDETNVDFEMTLDIYHNILGT